MCTSSLPRPDLQVVNHWGLTRNLIYGWNRVLRSSRALRIRQSLPSERDEDRAREFGWGDGTGGIRGK